MARIIGQQAHEEKRAAWRAASAAYRARHPGRSAKLARARYKKNAAAEIARTTEQAKGPRGKWRTNRLNALRRGVEWKLPFEEWMAFWGDDYPKRGPRKGDLLMARYGDKGPYAIGNIKKITRTENTLEFNMRRWAK